ncbi:MAG: WXG100 family type VII secretion target [Candidatus Coproplasma sp.]
MSNEIISNTENIDRVVKNFASQLEEYNKNMNAELASLKKSLVDLGHGWSGEGYDKFFGSMTAKIKTIETSLETCKGLKEYLDDVSLQLAKFLADLRAAGES